MLEFFYLLPWSKFNYLGRAGWFLILVIAEMVEAMIQFRKCIVHHAGHLDTACLRGFGLTKLHIDAELKPFETSFNLVRGLF